MIDKYEEIYARFKPYIESNSQYNAEVVKYNTNTPSRFPLVSFVLDDTKNTDNCTNDKIEFYDSHYFIINIYTKDKNRNGSTIASQVINDELTKLTIQFFDQLNMKRTLCKYTPNIDTNVLRRIINYQCLIGNVRGNIIRRWNNGF